MLDRNKKGMISRIYSTLASTIQDPTKLPCRSKWEQDLGNFGGDVWDLCLQSIPQAQFLPHTNYHNCLYYIELIAHQCNYLSGAGKSLPFALNARDKREIWFTCCGDAQNSLGTGLRSRLSYLLYSHLKCQWIHQCVFTEQLMRKYSLLLYILL